MNCVIFGSGSKLAWVCFVCKWNRFKLKIFFVVGLDLDESTCDLLISGLELDETAYTEKDFSLLK